LDTRKERRNVYRIIISTWNMRLGKDNKIKVGLTELNFEKRRWMEMAQDRVYGGPWFQLSRMFGFCFHSIRHIFILVLSISHLETTFQVMFRLFSVTIFITTITTNLTGSKVRVLVFILHEIKCPGRLQGLYLSSCNAV
jgi:hypothetical protein